MFAREYELVFVLRPDLEEDEVDAMRARTEKIIAERNGTPLRVDDWGKRRLAYDIQKYGKGQFLLVNYLGTPEIVDELERILRIEDSCLRFLTVKLSDRVDVDTRVAEEEVRAAAVAAREAEAADAVKTDGGKEAESGSDSGAEARA